jgi:hypothetical protein
MIRLLKLLIEGRVEDFKKKYSALPPDVQAEILKNDPSSNNKYLDWMGRIASTEPNLKLDTLIGDVEEFNKYQVMLGDINRFKSHNDLKQALMSRTKSKNQTTKEGAEIIIDNPDFLIVVPKTQDSCGYYGNNTRWCIVNQESYWNSYFYENTIIILLDRRSGEKYAIVGRSDYGDYSVYDKNDHQLSYSSFTRDEDEDGAWPEYVQEAIEEAMSSDDIEGRKGEHIGKMVDKFIEDEGADTLWENYLERVHSEYKLESEPSMEAFRNVLNSHGVTDEEISKLAVSLLYYSLQQGDGVTEDDLGEVNATSDIDSALRDMGELTKDSDGGTPLEYAVGDYVRSSRGVTGPLAIIEDAVGEAIFDKLYYKGTIDDDLFDAITKYNARLNSPQQMSLKGMDKGKESVHINNIQDVIYVFKNTGYEDRANYLSSVTGLKEVMKTYHPKARLL